MAAVEKSSDFPTAFLLAVNEKGFDSYYRGLGNSFLQVVGIGAGFHSLDSAHNPPTHLAEWIIAMGSLLAPFARLNFDLIAAREVESAVTQMLMERLNSGTHAEDLTRGRLPDRANTELFESLAWALGMCIVWFEEIEGEVTTRVFCRPEGHQWLFYGYFGFDGRKVYCFDHPTLRDHGVESPTRSCYQVHEQCNPIIVGRLIGDLNSPPPRPPSDSIDIAILRLLLDAAANVDPATVSESTRTYMQELSQQWNFVLEHPESVPVFVNIGLDIVKRAVLACACEYESSLPSGPTVDSHSLRDCPRFSHHNSQYINHVNHLVHEDCLQAFLKRMITADPSKPIKCDACPSLYSDLIVRQVLPDYQTIKDEALKRLQQGAFTSLAD